MMKSKIALFALLVCTGGMTSCIVDDLPTEKTPDTEVSLSLSFNTGTRAIGDPGTDHNEWKANWDKLGVYFVYSSGRVESFVLDKASFTSPETFTVFEGQAQVFAVAFPIGQTPPECKTVSEVYNMKTLSLDNDAVKSQKQTFMQNIFCGYSGEIQIEKEKNNRVDVQCTRLAAKVDLQYDMQAGIENGNLVSPTMFEVSFVGYTEAYVFPDKTTETNTLQTGVIETKSAQLSERNGRVYSYMYPGETAKMNFTMAVNSTTRKKYTIDFAQPLISNAWYKVNLNVTGSTATSPEENITLTLKENK